MDRLAAMSVSGKTEVALRAAFEAVMGGRRVTSHRPRFWSSSTRKLRRPLRRFPVKVSSLSRLTTAKPPKPHWKAWRTARSILLSARTNWCGRYKFKNLGLVIIDEEHRFGVRQKEQLKRLRANVDILTMTAADSAHPQHGTRRPARLR